MHNSSIERPVASERILADLPSRRLGTSAAVVVAPPDAPPALQAVVLEVVVIIGGAEGGERLAGPRLPVAKNGPVEPLQARVRHWPPNLRCVCVVF